MRKLLLIAALASFSLLATAGGIAPEAQQQLDQLGMMQFEEPLVPTGKSSPQEDIDLVQAIEGYRNKANAEDYSALTGYIERHPGSSWNMALYTNLGLSYYRTGRFSLAIDAFEQAWSLGKNVTEVKAKALTDRALGELLLMHARVGHAKQIEDLLKDMGARQVTGPATELVTNSKEGLWMMRNQPGISFLCGPMALKNLLLAQGASESQVQFLNKYQSSPQGVSLVEVDKLAKQAKLGHQIIFRQAGQSIPVPSIIHWKISHYAAIVEENNGRYHIKDPTFGEDLWVNKAAIDQEASGYFLIKDNNNAKAQGWRPVQLAEAGHIRGMGNTGNNAITTATKTNDIKAKAQNCPSHGMCTYNVHEMLVSLNLTDTPVGYKPPKGPAVYVTLTYNQREAGQPANFSYYNVSPKWALNWLSFIEDNPATAGANVVRRAAGGGSVNYSGYNSTTGQFTPEVDDASLLVRTSGNPIRYERRLADGSVEVYGQSNGATTAPRRIFMTRLIDAYGNAADLNYDAQLRLVSVTDATGRNTTFSYEHASNPLLVTKITDPFGRSATLSYDASGRLSSITDVIGLVSSFHYNASSLIDSMTTPYGTTGFTMGESGSTRWLEATDPLGFKERVEFRHQAPGITSIDLSSTVPQGFSSGNTFLEWRNTFYWDKQVYPLANNAGVFNYTKARMRHWLHLNGVPVLTRANSIESFKNPLENRLWLSYPGQPAGWVSGTLNYPNRTARVLDDGTTQLTQYAYNSLGNVTQAVDPLGRETLYDYAANGIDVTAVRQKTSATGYSTIAQFTYNNQHLPLTSTDAAGQVTTYTYNTVGQLTSQTNALNQTTLYSYDNLGYLTETTNANGNPQLTLTYDDKGRIASRTDSEGHTVTYAYDDFDRLTQATYPDDTSHMITYDKLDIASVTDREGRITQYTYDAIRNLTAVIDPLGQQTRYGYYPNGALKTLTDANGNVTTWNRDIQSRVTGKVYADNRQTAYSYETTTSRLKDIIDAKNQTKRFGYDKNNDVTGISYLNTLVPTATISFTYDTYFPRRTTMVDGLGTTQYQYKAPGQPGALSLAQEDGPYANDGISYQYDALGRVTNRTIDTSLETFTYDSLGRIAGHNSTLGNFNRSYLGDTGQITGQHLANTTIGTDWTYYDNFDDRRLLEIQNGGSARTFTYGSGPENLIGKITESLPLTGGPSKTWNYGYDDAGRLLTATSSTGNLQQYNYDPAGNLTNTSLIGPPLPAPDITGYTVNNVNQITAANATPYSYDANGNLTDDGVKTYTWNAEDRLTKINFKTEPLKAVQIYYNGLGHWTRIVTTNAAGVIEQRFLWCGETLCQERTATDAVRNRFYDEGQNHVMGNFYYARDHLGSVRDVQAIPGGNPAAPPYDYSAYGKPTIQGVPIVPASYAGLYYHSDAGLYLATYRAYNPDNGRWLNRDPIGEDGGINLYAYVGGNPVNLTDPSGLLFGGAFDAGESYGDSAAQYWADKAEQTGNPFFHIPGAMAAMWTPCTSDATAATLVGGGLIGRYLGRPFWQYYPAGNPAYSSPWFTRGWGWKPPYAIGTPAVEKLALPPYNPATAVRPVNPPWWKPVGGPTKVPPMYGQPGGGTQYKTGGWP